MFGLSRQNLYQIEKRQEARKEELSSVKLLVLAQRRKMPRLGTRKLHYQIRESLDVQEIKIGRDGLFRYLKSEQLLIRPRKKYIRTTNSNHWLRKYPNLYKETKASRSEEFFVSDITYLKCGHKTYYLSLVTDAYSRKIMGYYVSEDLSAENMLKALKMAIRRRLGNKPLIHHSDRGLQYCSAIYQDELRENQISPSMTDGYDCYQNALAERMNRILKEEFLIYKFRSKRELEIMVKESVEIYNAERPHLSLGMLTPNIVHENSL